MNRFQILLLSGASLALAGCGNDGQLAISVMPVERITPNAPQTVVVSGYRQAARLVISDEQTFAEVWARAFSIDVVAPPRPAVDFRREVVLVAALGRRPNGGYGIAIAGATETGHDVVVDVHTTTAGMGCGVPQIVTQPMDIVKIPRRATQVRFAEHPEVVNCR